MGACTWRDPERIGGLPARRFHLLAPHGGRIPGVLWGATVGTAQPLVLMQHGGSGHKHDESTVEQVCALLAAGLLAATIDGPIHGEREGARGLAGAAMRDAFLAQWRSAEPFIDSMVRDWECVAAMLAGLPQVDPARIGWMGVSMGTAYGLPFAARTRRLRAAVLGKWGAEEAHGERMLGFAREVQCPLLFIQRWDDELFTREGTLALFDALAARDKRLHVYPGSHFERGGEPLRGGVAFLRERLA
jgi:dienelactone hydrolase